VLTVVIVTFNSAAVLPACLASLDVALEAVGGGQLVVVDNASGDGSAELARARHGTRVVVMASNEGYAAAINAGVAATADHDDVLILNPDVELERGCLAALVAALEPSTVGIAVPRITGPAGELRHSLRREPSVPRALGEAVLGGRRAGRYPMLGEVVTDPAAYGRPSTVDWATGSTMLISGRCLADVGRWDESFFLYSEETDFALRARDKGWSVAYVPDAVCMHREGESGTVADLWALLTANRVRLYAKRHGRLATLAFGSAVALNEVLRLSGTTHRAALVALGLPGRRRALIDRLRAGASTPDYVCFAGVDWWYSNRAHSDFQLMRRVARSRRVLFVNSIGLRMPLPGRSTEPGRRIARKIASVLRFVRRPDVEVPGFIVLSPLVLPLYGSRAGRDLSGRIVRAQIRLVARALRVDNPIYVVTLPTAWDVVAPLPRRALIVNKADKYSSWSEVDQGYVEGLELSLLRYADRILYVSRAMMDGDAVDGGDRRRFLDHGVDLDLFRLGPAGDPPADLERIPRPRLGFFGSIDDYKIDFDLLERLAKELPEAHVVLIGDATCSMERFADISNVHWLGARPYETIPAYGSGFDVGLMPYLDNEWIRNSNPIKLKEYLALGIPSVCTDIPEAHFYEPWVQVAADRTEFIDMVARCLRQEVPGTPEQRRAVVAGSSWDARAAQLMAWAEAVR